MGLLWLVTLGWAFAFWVIVDYLSGQVDDFISVFVRVALAQALFVPLMVRRRPGLPMALKLMGIGAVQIGLMYLLLFHAYGFLSVPQLLLFTIFTPLYVTLIDECIIGRRRLPLRFWLAAVVAVAGAAVIRFDATGDVFLTGFLLVQAANICFAAGQVVYRRLRLGTALQQIHNFGYFFAGATLVLGVGVWLFSDQVGWPACDQYWGVLLCLGLVALGVGYLGWNMGARRVNTGQLAAMNNMLIPAGILVNVLIWNRDADWLRVAAGGVIIALAVWLARRPAAVGVRYN